MTFPQFLNQLQERPYFKLTFILIVWLIIFNLSHTKQEGFLILHPYHAHWLDNLFRLYTFTGEGITPFILVPVFFIIKQRERGIALLSAFITSGLAVVVLKKIIHQPRPRLYFEQFAVQAPDFIKNLSTHSAQSFPSGHTTTTFAITTVLALEYKNKGLSIFLFIAAALTAYSRIYLAEHFQQDILGGICIGVFFGVLNHYFICYKKSFLKSRKKELEKKESL